MTTIVFYKEFENEKRVGTDASTNEPITEKVTRFRSEINGVTVRCECIGNYTKEQAEELIRYEFIRAMKIRIELQ